MKRITCCIVLFILLCLCGITCADMSTVLSYQELQEQQEALYYQHLGQWFSLLNRIYTKDHMITADEQEKLKQVYADLLQDVRDIVRSSADGDAEYWAYLFNVDNNPDMSPDDERIYGEIIELTFKAYQENNSIIDRLEESTKNFWEYAFENNKFDRELYERAMAIVKELDNVIQSLHPSKEAEGEEGK